MINLEKRTEIIICGFGGQGILRAGYMLGTAASLGDNKESSFVPSYGPEARGGECASRIVISDEIIDYPFVTKVDLVVALSQPAYSKYINYLKEGGILIYDEDLVHPDDRAIKASKMWGIRALKLAEDLGNRIVANVIMLGFTCAITKIISPNALKDAIKKGVPKRFLDLNMKAFDVGYEKGMEALKTEKSAAR